MTILIREVTAAPPNWRPGQPLPPSVRATVVTLPEHAYAMGVALHPTVAARVAAKRARERKE